MDDKSVNAAFLIKYEMKEIAMYLMQAISFLFKYTNQCYNESLSAKNDWHKGA